MTLVAPTNLSLPPNATADQTLAAQIKASLPQAYNAFIEAAEIFDAKSHTGDFAQLSWEGGNCVIVPHQPTSDIGQQVAQFKATFLDAMSFVCGFHIGEPLQVTIGACCSLVVYCGSKPNLSWLQMQIDEINRTQWENRYDCG